jgi:Quinohemoprotein amine dehydrogenase A, alpha subunit, haem binding
MKILLALILAATLPMPGTKFKQLPAGKTRADVETACYACHSADLLAQQRLTPKQWTATVEKMMRWGAVVPEDKKTPIIDYLARNFGPGNKFVPTKVKPVSR